MAPALLAEAVGTFLFFFIGAGAALLATGDPSSVLLVVALAHGTALAVMVSSLGAVSGGHFNPAVTFGLLVAGKIDAVRCLAYWIAQLIGGAAAGYALAYLVGDVTPAVPALAGGVSVASGIVLEAILTAGLLLAVFGTAVDPRGPKIGGLVIGLAVAAGILVLGPLTGGAMNPARSIVVALAAGRFENWYVWWVGPLLGAAVVGLLYRYVFAEAEAG